jgi:hypothetical protein
MKQVLRSLFLISIFCLGIAGTGLWWTQEPVQKRIPDELIGATDAERALLMKNATPEKIAQIEEFGIKTLRNEPFSSAGIEALAIANGLRGKKDVADQLIIHASKFSMRNPSIQFTSILTQLSQKQYSGALFHADGLLRSRPDMGPQLFPVFVKLLADKTFVSELVKVLGQNPPWRQPLMVHMRSQTKEAGYLYIVMSALHREGVELARTEVSQLINMFISNKNYDQAYFVWLDLLKPEELKLAKGVFDGDFDLDPQNSYFGWTANSRPNSRISVALRPGSQTERGVVIDFSDETQRFANLYQYLKLAPGDYRLSYEAMGRNITTDSGLIWRIRCVEKPSDIGAGVRHAETAQWANYTTMIKVPETGCETQILILETDGKAALDAKMSGQLFFDKFAIDRLN